MYILNFVPIFASNYNLNDMLRIQEICKEKGITMQDLSKRMGVTYQALYANASGNPTIGKLQEIADALGVPFSSLFQQAGNSELVALINYRGEFYKATTIKDLEEVVKKIKKEV